LIEIVLLKTKIKLDKSNKKNHSEISKQESEELNNLDKELKDLIKKNESLKIGMKKIFKEIEKRDKNKNN